MDRLAILELEVSDQWTAMQCKNEDAVTDLITPSLGTCAAPMNQQLVELVGCTSPM